MPFAQNPTQKVPKEATPPPPPLPPSTATATATPATNPSLWQNIPQQQLPPPLTNNSSFVPEHQNGNLIFKNKLIIRY